MEPMGNRTLRSIAAQARKELEEEYHREAVEKEKARLRERGNRTLWERICPFRIVVIRR